jgi:hypothetical protein
MADGELTLDSLKADLDKQATALENLQEIQTLRVELQEVKHDLKLKWSHLQTLGIALSAVLTLVGGWGIRRLYVVFNDLPNDVSKHVHQIIDSDVEAQRKFYGDLMTGTSLTIQKNYNAAIPKLKKCFDEKHAYDKSVLIPLLESINLADDWADAEPILKKLYSDPQKFDEINDATIYRVIAAVEIQWGLSLRSRGQTTEGNARMDQGFALLTQASEVTQSNDYDTRVHILNNSWIYHISNGQIREAEQDVQAINRLPSEAQVYAWSKMKTWKCMKDFAAGKDPKVAKNLLIAEKKWKNLEKRCAGGWGWADCFRDFFILERH